MMEDGFLGIDHVPFNYRLRDARLRMGWSRKRLADEAHLDQGMVGGYESLKKWPVQAARERLATVLKDDPEYLFPAEIGVALKGHTAHTTTTVLPVETLTLDAPSMRLLPGADPLADWLDHGMLSEAIGEALDSLPHKSQAFVLRHRFGIGTDPKTLAEVGRLMRVTPARVMQLQAAGLRNLRYPERSRPLREWLRPSEIPEPEWVKRLNDFEWRKRTHDPNEPPPVYTATTTGAMTKEEQPNAVWEYDATDDSWTLKPLDWPPVQR